MYWRITDFAGTRIYENEFYTYYKHHSRTRSVLWLHCKFMYGRAIAHFCLLCIVAYTTSKNTVHLLIIRCIHRKFTGYLLLIPNGYTSIRISLHIPVMCSTVLYPYILAQGKMATYSYCICRINIICNFTSTVLYSWKSSEALWNIYICTWHLRVRASLKNDFE